MGVRDLFLYWVPIIIENSLVAKLLLWYTDVDISGITNYILLIWSAFLGLIILIGEDEKMSKEKLGISILFLLCFNILFISGIVLLIYGIRFIYCNQFECCSETWIMQNITGLSLTLTKRLHGQHLVIGPTVKHVRAHVEGNPQKPLVLSFHGLPGTGKNFVSTMLAQHLYAKGMHSEHVHFFSATKDFLHEGRLDEYKNNLKEAVEKAAGQCQRPFFIIDEMDKMMPGLIGALKPYLDYHEHVNGVDFRKSIFVFLSNTGGQEIARKTMDHMEEGFERSKLTLKEMEEVVRLPSYNAQNAYWHSDLIRNSLITAYIPFLPLERRHVEQCIIDGLFSKGYYSYEYQVDRDVVRTIADELTFFPEDTQRFSTTGCKRVLEKIDLIMQPEE